MERDRRERKLEEFRDRRDEYFETRRKGDFGFDNPRTLWTPLPYRSEESLSVSDSAMPHEVVQKRFAMPEVPDDVVTLHHPADARPKFKSSIFTEHFEALPRSEPKRKPLQRAPNLRRLTSHSNLNIQSSIYGPTDDDVLAFRVPSPDNSDTCSIGSDDTGLTWVVDDGGEEGDLVARPIAWGGIE